MQLNFIAAFQPVVTPFAGVWIEIGSLDRTPHGRTVTPFAGVWIEMDVDDLKAELTVGHPLRGGVD